MVKPVLQPESNTARVRKPAKSASGVSAVPSDKHVFFGGKLIEHAGDANKDCVSEFMTVAVIDQFEAINVAHQGGDWERRFIRTGKRQVSRFVEAAAKEIRFQS